MSSPESRRSACLERVLQWSRERDYAGHSKHDALNSPLVHALMSHTRVTRLVAIQALMRLPFNLRRLAGVPRLRNPKGIGLFAHAYLDLATAIKAGKTASGRLSCEQAVTEGGALLDWLMRNASPWTSPSQELREAFGVEPDAFAKAARPVQPGEVLKGLGWGYHYPWQDVGFFQEKHFPNRVVSSWIGFAFVRAFEVTGEHKYLLAAEEIVAFLLGNPTRIVDAPDQLCLSYVPLPGVDWAVMDVSALVAAMCARVARCQQRAGRDSGPLLSEAKRLIAFVADKQTDYGAWFYTWPSGDSHIQHDNYHTGIILDCLADYMTYSGDHAFQAQYRAGLEYYRRALFLENGAPRWMNTRTYPHDIHGAAAGCLAFARAGCYWGNTAPEADPGFAHSCTDMADRIFEWTHGTLYSGRGFFFHQRSRAFTKRYCLMRWCNAWMCRAMAFRLSVD